MEINPYIGRGIQSQVNLISIAVGRIKRRAVHICILAAEKLCEILYMPDVMRTPGFREIDVID